MISMSSKDKQYRNETAFVNDIIAAITKRYGGVHFKVHGGLFQRKGWPDILYWKDEHSFAFEAKTDNDGYEATELQKIKLAKLKAEGVHVAVVTQVWQVIAIIEEVIKGD